MKFNIIETKILKRSEEDPGRYTHKIELLEHTVAEWNAVIEWGKSCDMKVHVEDLDYMESDGWHGSRTKCVYLSEANATLFALRWL